MSTNKCPHGTPVWEACSMCVRQLRAADEIRAKTTPLCPECGHDGCDCAVTDPKPFEFTKEWCMSAAQSEGDSDPTTGSPEPTRMTDKTLASHCNQTPEDVYRELRRARAAELSEKARADRLAEDAKRETAKTTETKCDCDVPGCPNLYGHTAGCSSRASSERPPTTKLVNGSSSLAGAELPRTGEECGFENGGQHSFDPWCRTHRRSAILCLSAAREREARLAEKLAQFDAYAITVKSALDDRGEVGRLRADLRHAPRAVALWTRSAQRALDEADRLREALAKVRHPDSFGERCHCPDVCMVIDAALSPKDAP